MKPIQVYLIILLFFVNPSLAETETAAGQMQRFSKQVSIGKPTVIKVINHYGNIRLRKADDDQFIYHGVAQSQESQKVELIFNQDKDMIIAEVKYSNPDQTNHLDRYDLALIVPPMVSLEIEIEGGELTSKGLGSAIKVTSQTSDIQVKTSGPVELFTKQGSIDLSIKKSDLKIQSYVTTHEGQVNVKYYADMPRFEINSGSYITSNSVPLLKSLSKVKRTAYYGDIKNKYHLLIKSDTGQIGIIDTAQ